MSYPNSAANANAVLAGTLGGMCSGQTSTDSESADYQPLIAPAVATSVTVDALVEVTFAPPPLVAQSNIIAELSYGAWDGRNPSSGTAGETAVEIEAQLANGLPDGIYGAFLESLVLLGAGTTGNTPANLNAAYAGALGAMLDGAVNAGEVPSEFSYVTSAAYAAAIQIDEAIGIDGSASVVRENMLCEITFAWLKGRNPSAWTGATPAQQTVLAAEFAPFATAIAQYWLFAVEDGLAAPQNLIPPNGGVPHSAAVWDAAFCGAFGGILAGQPVAGQTVPSTYISVYVAAVAAFAYAIDAEVFAVGAEVAPVTTVYQQDILRHMCRAWMTGRNTSDNSAATTITSYADIASGIIAYYAEVIAASIIQ